MTEIRGRHLSQTSGIEHTYILTVRPGGREIWSAQVFRDKRLVCMLARGLVEAELGVSNLIEHVRGLLKSHIDSLC